MLESVDMTALAFVAAVACVAGFVTGFAGFGTGLVASGLWLHLMPAPQVPPLVAICSVVAQITCLPTVRREVHWRALFPYLIGAAAGVPFGVLAMQDTLSYLLRPAVGALLLVFVAFGATAFGRLRVRTFGGRILDTFFGAGSGLLGGFAGLSAPILVIWLRVRGGTPDQQRAIYQPFSLLVLSATLLVMWIDGHLNQTVLMAASFCLPATLLGALLGVRHYRKVSQNTFRRVVLFLLGLTGLGLLVFR